MKVYILLISIFIAACSSYPTQDANVQKKSLKEIELINDSGKLVITYNQDNQSWIDVRATANAKINSQEFDEINNAIKIATLKARASLLEFLENKIETKNSYRTKSTIKRSNDNQKSYLVDSEQINSDTEEIGNVYQDNQLTNSEYQLIQKVSSEAKGKLYGVSVSNQTIHEDSNQVFVTVELSKNSMNVAADIIQDTNL
jgi:hypothetical protein